MDNVFTVTCFKQTTSTLTFSGLKSASPALCAWLDVSWNSGILPISLLVLLEESWWNLVNGNIGKREAVLTLMT